MPEIEFLASYHTKDDQVFVWGLYERSVPVSGRDLPRLITELQKIQDLRAARNSGFGELSSKAEILPLEPLSAIEEERLGVIPGDENSIAHFPG